MAGLQLLQWDTALQQTASERAKQLGEASKCLTLSPEIDWQAIDVLPLASPKLLRSDWLESDDEKSRRQLSISHAPVQLVLFCFLQHQKFFQRISRKISKWLITGSVEPVFPK